jgi:hypothetical protein
MLFENAVLRVGAYIIAEGLKGDIQVDDSQPLHRAWSGRIEFHESAGLKAFTDMAAHVNAELEVPGVFKGSVEVIDAAGNFKGRGPIKMLDNK